MHLPITTVTGVKAAVCLPWRLGYKQAEDRIQVFQRLAHLGWNPAGQEVKEGVTEVDGRDRHEVKEGVMEVDGRDRERQKQAETETDRQRDREKQKQRVTGRGR